MELLTRSPLLNLFYRDSKNIDGLYRYLGDYMRHFRRR
jgi:hypothetical protein